MGLENKWYHLLSISFEPEIGAHSSNVLPYCLVRNSLSKLLNQELYEGVFICPQLEN